MFRAHTWIVMIADAFDAADRERDALTANGPWTARTNNIQRYAHVDYYA